MEQWVVTTGYGCFGPSHNCGCLNSTLQLFHLFVFNEFSLAGNNMEEAEKQGRGADKKDVWSPHKIHWIRQSYNLMKILSPMTPRSVLEIIVQPPCFIFYCLTQSFKGGTLILGAFSDTAYLSWFVSSSVHQPPDMFVCLPNANIFLWSYSLHLALRSFSSTFPCLLNSALLMSNSNICHMWKWAEAL